MAEVDIHEVPRPLREMYEKGRAAFAKQNFDYAITLFDQVLRKAPGFYACREALRATQFTKAQKGSSIFKKFLGSANPLLAKAQVQLRTNPGEAIQTAEQILNKDPNNSAAHRVLADAALAADLPKTAVLSLEILFKKNPNDRNNALKLGQALGKVGRSEKGEQVLSALKEAYPDDQEIGKALNYFTARRTLDEGGYEKLSGGQGSYRDILKNVEEAISLEQQNRDVKTSEVADRLIQDYERQLEAEPNDLKVIRLLGDLHVQKGEFERGLEYYRRIASLEGGNEPAMQRLIAATQIKQYDDKIGQLATESPEKTEEIERLTREKQEFEVRECEQRSRQFPNDLEIRFELGQLYYGSGRFNEAIKEFQRSQNHPHWRVPSLKFLGRCFRRRGIYDLAVRALENGIKQKEVFDEEKKELIYELGLVLEQSGHADQAIEQFKQIYEVDIGYQDVAEKIDAYYADQSESR